MSYWWRWWGGSAPPPDPVQALLDEAAVRFDFSQYDDINNMVDVNGGWGPIVPNITADTTEFTADGLRVTVEFGLIQTASLDIESVESPAIFGSGGLTLMSVTRVNSVEAWGVLAQFESSFDLAADGAGEYLPEGYGRWRVLDSAEDCQSNLSVLSFADVVDVHNDPTGTTDAYSSGAFILAFVFDVPNEELRISLVGPNDGFVATYPFAMVPDLSSPVTADTIFVSSKGVSDETFIESLIWNRALSDSEIDALVAHFQA